MTPTLRSTATRRLAPAGPDPIVAKWFPPLDGLRGLAILMVMLFHYENGLNPHNPLQHILRSLWDFGWTGVDLFFVLSGFLITGILLDTRSASNYYSAFYARRVLRIFPLYYLSLPLIFFVVAPDGSSRLHWLAYLIYAQNWMKKVYVSTAGHYWSLAVEEQFYFLWPLVVHLFKRRQVLWISAVGAAACIPLRLALLAAHVDSYYLYQNTLARMDTLLIGAACACLLREEAAAKTLFRHSKWLWAAPLVIFPLLKLSSNAVGFYWATQRYGYTVIALAYASVLLGAIVTMGSGSILQRFFTSGIMRAFGKYSYAAYIWHRMVAAGVQACERKIHTPLPWFVEIPLMIAATFAVSMASYALIERPFLALKRYFEPRYISAAPDQ